MKTKKNCGEKKLWRKNCGDKIVKSKNCEDKQKLWRKNFEVKK